MAEAVGSLMILLTFNPASSPALIVALRCLSLKYAGTEMIASSIFSLRYVSASSFNERRTKEDNSSAEKLCSPRSKILLVPIARLKTDADLSGCKMPYSLAVSPTRMWPLSSMLTIDGVIFFPRRLTMISVLPFL